MKVDEEIEHITKEKLPVPWWFGGMLVAALIVIIFATCVLEHLDIPQRQRPVHFVLCGMATGIVWALITPTIAYHYRVYRLGELAMRRYRILHR